VFEPLSYGTVIHMLVLVFSMMLTSFAGISDPIVPPMVQTSYGEKRIPGNVLAKAICGNLSYMMFCQDPKVHISVEISTVERCEKAGCGKENCRQRAIEKWKTLSKGLPKRLDAGIYSKTRSRPHKHLTYGRSATDPVWKEVLKELDGWNLCRNGPTASDKAEKQKTAQRKAREALRVEKRRKYSAWSKVNCKVHCYCGTNGADLWVSGNQCRGSCPNFWEIIETKCNK